MTATAEIRTIPRLIVTFDEWLQLFTLATDRLDLFPYPDNPLVFSCSRHGIWPTTRRGYIHQQDRTLVNGQSWVLDTIAALMLGGATGIGGRFAVTVDGAYRLADMDAICFLELTA